MASHALPYGHPTDPADDGVVSALNPHPWARSETFHPMPGTPENYSLRGGSPFEPYRDLPAEDGRWAKPGGPPSPALDGTFYPAAPAVVAGYTPVDKSPYLRQRAESRARARYFYIALVLLLVVAAAVVVPIYFFVIRKHTSSPAGSSGGASSASGGTSTTAGAPGGTGSKLIVGVDGTSVTTPAGDTFVYKNPYGGYFYDDPNDSFNNGARAQSWVPALNETWTWGKDRVKGVNLGGWLVLEPFLIPALFQKYITTPGFAGDEWTLSEAMTADTGPGGGIVQIEDHYKNFITERDFAEIPGAGLNFVRLPMPYWAIETWPGEPFLPKKAWTYVLLAFSWARKYGLRVNLDLHTVPGAQNPYLHSGREGEVDWMSGVMGYANAQRWLGYVRYITEFISQPEYSNLVLVFGMVNEPVLDFPPLRTAYLEAYSMIRNITGIGAGSGPYVSIHDQFVGPAEWAGFLAGSDRMALDWHPYFTFGSGNAPDLAPFLTQACTDWQTQIEPSQKAFGVTLAGEWSLGFNDCGLYVKGISDPHSTTGCNTTWDLWENYTADTKASLMTFAYSQMDALQNWFFWAWKVGNDTASNSPRSPLWSYQLGLAQGWMPTDPRSADGACSSLGAAPAQTFDGTYAAWATGGAGAGTISADQIAEFGVWPPTSIPVVNVPATQLPSYTQTGAVITLPTDSAAVVPSGTTLDGWANTADTAMGYTTIAGCTYPDAWSPGAVIPPLCPTAAPAARSAPQPTITPPPRG